MSAEITFSKVIDLSFHHVVKVGMTEVRRGLGDTYIARDIVITDKDGRRFEIVLFADSKAEELDVFKMIED